MNVAPQNSQDINEMYIQDNGFKLFDPVADEPTPDHGAVRTSSEYVNTDEEEEVEAVDADGQAEQGENQLHAASGNQYSQHNMHPLKQTSKQNRQITKMKSDDRKALGRQVMH